MLLVPNFVLSIDENNEDTGVFETSYVEYPATGYDFLAFNDSNKKMEFKMVNKGTQRITSGVWMMPDTKYPKMTSTGEFYTVEFKKEDLYNALMNYLKRGNADSIKVEHTGASLDGFVALEHWVIKDSSTVSPVLGLSLQDLGYNADEIPEGTVMKSTYVADEQFWNENIMTGKVKGYSIGGLFAFEPDAATKKEWNFASVFNDMGLKQDGGDLILDDDRVLSLKDDVKVNGEKVKDGEFSTKSGWTITVREGEIVDYVFNETAPVTEVQTEVAEVVAEVVDVVAEVKEEASDLTVNSQTPRSETQPTQVTPSTDDKLAQLIARMEALESKLSLQDAEIARRDAVIATLEDDKAKADESIKKLNEKVAKSPIEKTKTTKPETAQSANTGSKVRVGNKIVNVRS